MIDKIRVLGVLGMILIFKGGDTLVAGASSQCYSCDYQFAGDGTRDYECVADPANVKTGSPTIPCSEPRMCITKGTFDTTMRLMSFSRRCGVPQFQCSGPACCFTSSLGKTCESTCNSRLCNGGPPATQSVTGSAAQLPVPVMMILAAAMMVSYISA